MRDKDRLLEEISRNWGHEKCRKAIRKLFLEHEKEYKDKLKRIAKYNLLPTIEELVNSKKKVKVGVTYYTKEKGSYEDSCDGTDGSQILEMREIGIGASLAKELEFFTSEEFLTKAYYAKKNQNEPTI